MLGNLEIAWGFVFVLLISFVCLFCEKQMLAEDSLGRDLQGKIPLPGNTWGGQIKHHQTPVLQVNSCGVKREEKNGCRCLRRLYCSEKVLLNPIIRPRAKAANQSEETPVSQQPACLAIGWSSFCIEKP